MAFAVVGLSAMMNSGGAVMGVEVAAGEGGRARGAVASVHVRGAGRLLAYSSHRPARVACGGLGLLFTWDAGTGRLEADVPATESLRATLTITM